MYRGNSCVWPLAALHFVVFCLMPTAASTHSDTLAELMADAPSAEEIALFEELIDWIGEGEPQVVAGPELLRQAIRARPASFDVFRTFHDDGVRYERLNEIPFGDAIRNAAERHGVDGLLIAAIVEAESSFDPCAISDRGAVGLMQVMPATAGVTELDRLTEPENNIDLGTGYLRYLLGLYEGNLELALAAYNAGPANVRRFGGLPPFRETQRYVEKVLGAYVSHHQEIWLRNATHQTLGLGPVSPAGA
ncbi:MAG: lytic transglycosylase domain-containing protein [Acidobacteriota bacterium]